MDQDGNANRYLTDGSFLALTPRFSPDGGRIAYMGYRGGPPRIYVDRRRQRPQRRCSATSLA